VGRADWGLLGEVLLGRGLTQPVSVLIPNTLAANNISCAPRRFLRPKKHSAPASCKPEESGLDLESGASDAAEELAACTVSENVVACCNEPDVAVTVTVEIVGWGLPGEDGLERGLTQPVIRARPMRLAASSMSWTPRRFFLPSRNSIAASAEPGSHRPGLLRVAADAAAVLTVSVETMLPAAFAVVGEKLHVAPVGRPEQLNATAEVVGKPFSGVTVTVSVPLAPAVTISDAEETANVKFGAGAVALVVALTWFEDSEFPSESVASSR